MKNFVQKGHALDVVTPAGGMVAGVFYMIGALFGVAALTSAVGEANVLDREGVFTQPKATGAAWAQGDPLYWDVAGAKFTKTAAGNRQIGVAAAAALTGDTTGKVLLNPGARVIAGQVTTASASDTIVTGLAKVIAAGASMDDAPVIGCDRAQASIGDQNGAPASGSILLKTYKPTASGDATPVAATTFGKKVNYWAFGY